MEKYAPLELLSRSLQPGREFISRKQQFIQYKCKNLDKMTVNDYINYFVSEDFYDIFSTNKYSDITLLLKENEKLLEQGADYKTEWKDLYLAPVLLEEWSKNKQVYKPDSDFANALLKTKHLVISSNMVRHLPCNYFYIDTSDCKNFDHIEGLFVFVIYNAVENKVDICIYMLTDYMLYFSFYDGGYFGSDGLLPVDFDQINNSDYDISLDFVDKSVKNVLEESNFDLDIKLDRKAVSLLALQMIAYLSMDKPQVTPSELTKNTYVKKPATAKVKNKWSEVHIDDVGVKYGTEFRKAIAKYRNSNHNTTNTDDSNKRRSPIPHFRCAHWHGFWVGKGRTEYAVKWMEPVYVGGENTKDVVIHRVKTESSTI